MLSVPRGSSLDAVSFLERGQVDFAPLSISAGLREPREELPKAYLLLLSILLVMLNLLAWVSDARTLWQ